MRLVISNVLNLKSITTIIWYLNVLDLNLVSQFSSISKIWYPLRLLNLAQYSSTSKTGRFRNNALEIFIMSKLKRYKQTSANRSLEIFLKRFKYTDRDLELYAMSIRLLVKLRQKPTNIIYSY